MIIRYYEKDDGKESSSNRILMTLGNYTPGVLVCTSAATITPAWLADSLEWSITPIQGSNLTTIPDPPRGDTVIFRFENLPALNNEFGRKYISASLVGYDVEDSVMVKVFFPKYATNNPDTLHDWPNWYYYWRYTPACVVAPQDFGGHACNSSTRGFYDFGLPGFNICPAAAESSGIICALADWHGIDVFAATERHENQHKIDYFAWWNPIGGYWRNRHLDADSDYVPSHIEPSLGFDSLNALSNPYAPYGIRDWEYRGYILLPFN